MNRLFRTSFMLLALAVAADLPAQSSRQERLREHERRMKEIIENRRKEEQARQEANAKKEEEEAAQKGLNPEVMRQMDDKIPDRVLSTVVMGFKFLDKSGSTDYNAIVNRGEEFITEVYLYNVDGNPIDRVRLALDFDKRFIAPVRVFDTAIRPYMKGEPTFSIDERDGLIRYEAELKEPIATPEVVLLRVKWKAVRSTPYSGIEFRFSALEKEDEPHTGIYARGKNILGSPDDSEDGVLSGGVMVDPPESEPKTLQGKASELKEIYLGSIASQAKVGMQLEGPKETPKVGENFVVKVRLNNPNGAIADSLNFFVVFDPNVVRMVDSDKFNWIRRGINAHDGPYHRDFPWDMYKRNEARNERGLLAYEMSIGNGRALPTATVADIHFRALAPIVDTPIGFVKDRSGAAELTSVRYFGYEMLDLEDEKLSTPTVFVSIDPADPNAKQPDLTTDEPAKDEEPAPEIDRSVRKLTVER